MTNNKWNNKYCSGNILASVLKLEAWATFHPMPRYGKIFAGFIHGMAC